MWEIPVGEPLDEDEAAEVPEDRVDEHHLRYVHEPVQGYLVHKKTPPHLGTS